MNSVDIRDQLRANSYIGRRTRRGGWQTLCHLFLLKVAIINSSLLDKYGSQHPYRERFRRQLYEQIFLRFGQATVTLGASRAGIHTPTHRTKRGWYTYYSSTKRNNILGVKKAGPHHGQRRHMGIFGCDTYDVPLYTKGTRRDY